MQRHPTLLNGCALAATAGEARYRISYDIARRDSRVIALGGQAAGLVRSLAGRGWGGGHFLTFEAAVPANGPSPDARLSRADGSGTWLSEELTGADTVVMIAGGDGTAEAASVIGDACAARGIMSAGLVIPGPEPAGEVVAALRPNAMVLVILQDAGDVPEILAALRV